MTSQLLIVTPLHISKILRPIWLVKPSFPRSAIITPFGLYEFCRMPFGLRNAAQTFQRFIDDVCRDLPFVFVYLDDILVASSALDEHLQHPQALFQRLSDHGLVINPAKWEFGKSEVNFLSHTIPPSIPPVLRQSAHFQFLKTRKRCISSWASSIIITALFPGVLRSYSLFTWHLQRTVLHGLPPVN